MSRVSAAAPTIHFAFILTSLAPSSTRDIGFGCTYKNLTAQQAKVYHRVSSRNADRHHLLTLQGLQAHLVLAPRQARARDGHVGGQRAPCTVISRVERDRAEGKHRRRERHA